MVALNDKTVVLAGPFGLLMQNLIARITECGADVVAVTDDIKSAQRVCQNFMDMREVSEKYGRASAVELEIKDQKSAENTFSRSAEIFGGVDVYIDTQLFGLNIAYFMSPKVAAFDKEFGVAFDKIKLLTKSAGDFLKSRSRARILYLFNELDLWTADKLKANSFNEFIEFVRVTGQSLAAHNTTVNAMAVGVNEEYLLSRFGRSMTIQQSLKDIAKNKPGARMVDFSDLANVVSFMVSPLSSGINGQVVHVDHGI